MEDYGLEFLYNSGALLTRLIGDPPQDQWDMDSTHVYWNAHVDKAPPTPKLTKLDIANIPTYDYSALLYLNSLGEDFTGGGFEFIDDDANRVVEPRAGRLVTFTSGPENLHRVRKVASGTRYVLAMWFTCSEAHQYEDEDTTSVKQLEKLTLALRQTTMQLSASKTITERIQPL
ncbi:2OG-Fe(II) oxygenase superfamily-domain-containing protein [Baffinella frigidus]|nr:2OG-Fe(II) oxygenase superfamily-domain-containing protein [Cryptophyta sp. CCMP2293]